MDSHACVGSQNTLHLLNFTWTIIDYRAIYTYTISVTYLVEFVLLLPFIYLAAVNALFVHAANITICVCVIRPLIIK
jgi:hypothetical protein